MVKNIIMIGNSPKVKGGITTVINQFKSIDWSKHDINMTYISSYSDKNIIAKLLIYVSSIIKLVFRCTFKKIDIIHVHMSYKGSFTRAYYIQKIAKLFKIKYISHMHGSEFEKWYQECNNKKRIKIVKYLRQCNKIIVLGSEWEKKIRKIYDCPNIIVLPNSIQISDKTSIWKEKKRIIFLGVLIKRKGIKDLLSALHMSKNISNIEVAIAGTGDQEEELRTLTEIYNINEKVRFLGWVDSKQKIKELLDSQALILPSYNEGLPMAILEAMSYGLPIISTDVGDIKTVVHDGKNGYLMNPGDINKMVEILEKFDKISISEWNTMSSYSKNIIETNFSLDKYIEKMVDIYYK